ncbi:MAG TPA: phosphoribosyltransferase [Chthonomonadales bacterium]|nr:phosphoribosyltransferase [Chthonomonadales bacterium]
MQFQDRADAGRQLANALQRYSSENPIVVALPRGGVPVALEVARGLHADLDVMAARKIGAPWQPELGIGAVAPDGVQVLDSATIESLGIEQHRIDRIAAAEIAEMDRRTARYRGGRPVLRVTGRTAILVDDGLATGVTARAAIASLRKQNPARLVLAVPVCAAETAQSIASEVDDLVCLMAPEQFQAVGLWYRDFAQLTDDDVVRMLSTARTKESDSS